MGKKILVAGASGAVGRRVVQVLKAGGWWVRTLSSSEKSAQTLKGFSDDLRVGDLTHKDGAQGLCEGIDVVISTVGASLNPNSRDRRSFRDVDYVGNLRLLLEAQSKDVGRFIYLGAFVSRGYENTEYIQAHERFVDELRSCGIGYSIVRPTGIFSAFDEYVKMARRGFVIVVGEGTSRTNPVHPVEVAEACVELIGGGAPEVPLGGPEVLTRKEVAELALKAVGKKGKIVHISPKVVQFSSKLAGLWNPKMAALMDFLQAVSTHDAIAPIRGTRRLESYFREIALK